MLKIESFNNINHKNIRIFASEYWIQYTSIFNSE